MVAGVRRVVDCGFIVPLYNRLGDVGRSTLLRRFLFLCFWIVFSSSVIFSSRLELGMLSRVVFSVVDFDNCCRWVCFRFLS